MSKFLSFFLPVFCLFSFLSAAAESTVIVQYREPYMCGDSFEVTFPDEPSTTSMISRSGSVHAKSDPETRLLLVRVVIRNLTPEVINGLAADSFKLTGYVRDRSLSYTPIVMESYDYTYGTNGSSHSSADGFVIPPLREEDILLVFKVNPILLNWELLVEPRSAKEVSGTYGTAVYPTMELDPCKGLFQFFSIRNAETGEITKYVRDLDDLLAVTEPTR